MLPYYRKHFIPLESNPDVFNELLRLFGASNDLRFHDVSSLDPDDFLEPAIALILVFPTTERYVQHIASEKCHLEAIQSEDII